ncbi:MAG: hypothetical protein A2527_11070 [Candidatus Lambdaproteobacteria bacterium RIFOXYD2_FULL_50_16]|uniref:PIN domain-containing protein n=1 Tax=Candidatus Lambdaproteobacteria bacterium RIFOXYD2_FULL_50_16 TaxID=1817772 RepID=A0A1F6G6C2_9PROT|nr:MAG: hypothetical protein A2527_11070 [Candidatus Lambdaproteobacteria bacterium RIFOXYD2_FULL_50_16]
MNQQSIFVLDTNVLLGDPDALFDYPGAKLILPLSVLDEMDQFKKEYNERGRNARVLAQYLDKIRLEGSLTQGVTLENGSVLLVDLEEGLKPQGGLNPLKGSNRVLLATAAIQKRLGRPVTLVTNDLNLRVRASALGVEVKSHDEQGRQRIDLYQGMLKLEPNEQQAHQLEKLGYIEKEHIRCFPNQNLVIERHGVPELYRYHENKGRLKRVKPLDRGVYGLYPKNQEQIAALDLLLDEEVHIVTLAGKAGTGKTLLALAAAMELLIKGGKYQKILVSRPIFPMGRDMGYLPGDIEEKLAPWMQPIMDNLEYLSGLQPSGAKARGHEGLLEKGLIELEPLTYIRGRSIPDRIMIVDEAQNLTPHELKTIVTRTGEGTKLILTGDPYQVDNPYLDPNSNGLTYLIERFQAQAIAGHVTLLSGVRSRLAELAANLL